MRVTEKESTAAKPRLDFGRGRASSDKSTSSARKHVPVEDALAKMAGKIGERRRSLDEAREAGEAA